MESKDCNFLEKDQLIKFLKTARDPEMYPEEQVMMSALQVIENLR